MQEKVIQERSKRKRIEEKFSKNRLRSVKINTELKQRMKLKSNIIVAIRRKNEYKEIKK